MLFCRKSWCLMIISNCNFNSIKLGANIKYNINNGYEIIPWYIIKNIINVVEILACHKYDGLDNYFIDFKYKMIYSKIDNNHNKAIYLYRLFYINCMYNKLDIRR